MIVDKEIALHIFDKGIKYNAATFLKKEEIINVWDAFM